MEVLSGPNVSRRTVMKMLGVLGVAVVAGPGILGTVRAARAQAAPGLPQPEEKVAETLKRLFGDRPIKDGAELLKFEAPLIAENGSVVPVTVEANVPMTPERYAKHIYIIADKNRRPLNAKFSFSPDAGAAYIGTNIRLASSMDIRAVVEMSDGSLYQVKRDIKVTVGGCGG